MNFELTNRERANERRAWAAYVKADKAELRMLRSSPKVKAAAARKTEVAYKAWRKADSALARRAS